MSTGAHCRPPKKEKPLTFHWKGRYLTRSVLDELLAQIAKAGTERQKMPCISLNWPQAVLHVEYVCQPTAGYYRHGAGKRGRRNGCINPVSVHPSPSDQHLFSLKCKAIHPDFFLRNSLCK